MKHPNAVVALLSGSGLGSAVAYLLDDVAHLHVSPTACTAIGGVFAAVALFIGRNGFAGVWSLAKHGTTGEKNAGPPPEATPPS